MGGRVGDHQASQESFFVPSQMGKVGLLPATSPYWRTWMTDVQSWQVSVMIEPWGGKGVPSPQPRQAGLPGPSRGAALAVRPTLHGQQPEEVPGELALPSGERPSFKGPEVGLPADQDPMAGASSQVRRHGYLGEHSHPEVGPLARKQTPVY